MRFSIGRLEMAVQRVRVIDGSSARRVVSEIDDKKARECVANVENGAGFGVTRLHDSRWAASTATEAPSS